MVVSGGTQGTVLRVDAGEVRSSSFPQSLSFGLFQMTVDTLAVDTLRIQGKKMN
jgi:hypothetical protein